jgi:hypothetical protein
LSKLKYVYHTPIQLVGAEKHINVSKLQWCKITIKKKMEEHGIMTIVLRTIAQLPFLGIIII